VEDQAAFIRNRIEDIRGISDQLTTAQGIMISDRLLFFMVTSQPLNLSMVHR